MGMKSIHLLLIFLSIVLSGFFGYWCSQHQQPILSIVSYVITVGVVVYGFYFIKKAGA